MKLNVLLVTSFYLILFAVSSSFATNGEALETNLRHAKTYYWLGIQDKGDPKAFQNGLSHLDIAEVALLKYRAELDDGDALHYEEVIRLMRTDLEEQYLIARNNFAGRFPLARFLGESPFMRPDSYGSFELATPPGELASSRAAKSIGNIINQGLWGDAQLPMLVFSDKNELPDMESALRAIFKLSFRVKAYERSFLNTFLSSGEIESLAEGNPGPQVLDKLIGKLGAGLVALTHVDLYNEVDDIKFFRFTTNIYVESAESPVQSILHYELVRDKRYMRPWLILLFSSFILLSILCFYLLNARFTDQKVSLKSIFLLPVTSWVIGFASSMVVLSILATIKPAFQDYITYSFWWVPLALLLLILAATILVRKIILLSPWLKNFKGNKEESASLFLISSFGTSSLLGIGILLYHGAEGIFTIMAMAYLFGMTSYAFGKVMDKIDPRPIITFIPFILLVPISAPVVAGSVTWFVFVLIGATGLLHLWYVRYNKSVCDASYDDSDTEDAESSTTLSNLKALRKRIEFTPFFETERLKRLLSKVDLSGKGRFQVLCLCGNDGVGKTTIAKEIIRRAKSVQDEGDGFHVLVLKGFGEEAAKKANPYYTIRQALKGISEIGLFEELEEQTDDIDSLLDGVIKNVVPFSGLFLSDKSKQGQQVSSQEELFYNLAVTFKKLAKKQKVIFFLDDIHWLDDASMDLLKYLHDFFQQYRELPILFLYTSRPYNALDEVFETGQVINVPAFSDTEYASFLSEVFLLEASSVKLIVKWVGGQSAGKGNLFWLFKILDLLAKGDHLKKSNNKFMLSEKLLEKQTLPIPEEYRLTIREELQKQDQYKNIIGVAAVMGMQFDAYLVARALNINQLDCLEALDSIERESNLLYDVTEKDGIFSFRSSFTLETIREELGIFDILTGQTHLRQIIKEYYAIAASVLEEKTENSELMRIATCFFNAGPTHAAKAFDASIKAANSCLDLFRYAETRKFIHMAENSIRHIDQSHNQEIELAMVKIRLTTSEGKNDELGTEKMGEMLDYINEMNALYLNEFINYLYHTRNFDKGLKLAGVLLSRASSSLETSQGLFWKGLCLPLGKTEERINALNNALYELEKEAPLPDENVKLKSRILNALGELYSELAVKDKKHKDTAREFLLKSIEIKKDPAYLDRAGMARSYGGLGRLELNVEPSNPEKALKYFQQDLELSKITGDYKGQVKMHSFIGACFVKMGDQDKAVRNYQISYEMSTDIVDRFFALMGMLETSSSDMRPEIFEKSKRELSGLLQDDRLPAFCMEPLSETINNHPDHNELISLLENKD